MDAWERWQIVCLAALSVEDIEDIYLFGTMITGLLLIGLGFAPGYRRIQKMGTAVQSLTRSALRLRLLTAIWILSWRSSRLCKRKLTIFEIRMYKESSRGIGMRLLAPSLNNRNLIFFGSPVPALALAKVAVGKSTLGRALQWDALAPSPPSLEPPAWQAGLWPAPEKVAAGPDGCLLELDYFPCGIVVCLCFCVLRCFSCSHTVLPKEHSLGVIFFSSLSSCYAVFLFNSTCISLHEVLIRKLGRSEPI